MEDNPDPRKHLDSLRKDLIAFKNGLQESQGELFLAQQKLHELEENELWEGPTIDYPERYAELNNRIHRLTYEINKLNAKIDHRKGAIWRTINVMRGAKV